MSNPSDQKKLAVLKAVIISLRRKLKSARDEREGAISCAMSWMETQLRTQEKLERLNKRLIHNREKADGWALYEQVCGYYGRACKALQKYKVETMQLREENKALKATMPEVGMCFGDPSHDVNHFYQEPKE